MRGLFTNESDLGNANYQVISLGVQSAIVKAFYTNIHSILPKDERNRLHQLIHK